MLGELSEPVQVKVVVAGKHEAALARAGQHASPRSKAVSSSRPVLRRSPRAGQVSTRTRRSVLLPGQRRRGRRLGPSACQLADEVAGSTTMTTRSSLWSRSETPPAGRGRGRRRRPHPQQRAGSGRMVAGRLQQPPAFLAELGQAWSSSLVLSSRRVGVRSSDRGAAHVCPLLSRRGPAPCDESATAEGRRKPARSPVSRARRVVSRYGSSAGARGCGRGRRRLGAGDRGVTAVRNS